MDPLSMVEDEVALEGLDGITIPTLWIRLEDRKPKFPLKLDDRTKELVWRSLLANSDISFHLLPAPRDDVVLYDRFNLSDEDIGNEEKKDVYPLHIVRDSEDGTQGSCATFCRRTDITARLRSPSPASLDEVFKRYGGKLVAVASQERRFRALIGSENDPDVKLVDESYCMLERVGRARWQGELQSELHRSSFKLDSRKLHYMRKPLIRHGLVCTQACTTRLKSGHQQSSVLLLLKRFNVIRRSKYDMLMEYVSNLLQKMPKQLAALVTIRDHLNLPPMMCKRVFRCMRDIKIVDYCSVPLEDLDKEGKPVRNKNGKKVQVRCLKLLKPYTGKGAMDEWKDDEDDEDDEDEDGNKLRALPPVGRIMEEDFLSQAYKMIVSCGPKGIPQSGIGSAMNVGKLEARMIWRKLERSGLIKGFMVDEGRQRVTKFIGHRSVRASDDLQLLTKEKQRKKLLDSSASPVAASTPKASSCALAARKQRRKTPKKSRAASEDVEEECRDASQESQSKVGTSSSDKDAKNAETPIAEASPTPAVPDAEPVSTSEKTSLEEKEEDEGSMPPCKDEEETAADSEEDMAAMENVDALQFSSVKKRTKETYRLLKRKNLIVEAVHRLKVVEEVFHLQKLINHEEKLEGFSSKCCKKTTKRLVQNLAREGLLKIFTTTIIQDGISRKLEFIVHPSIQPSDKLVRTGIEHARFKLTRSCSTPSQAPTSSKESPPKVEKEEISQSFKSFGQIKEECAKHNEAFKPTRIHGLGKTFGFQPKMHRMRVLHTFLWYTIYDHPMGPRPPWRTTPEDASEVAEKPAETMDDANVTLKALRAPLSGEEAEGSNSNSEFKVYCDEDSWKRFIPPILMDRERGNGWVLVSNLLLCLPLSIFIQIVQINYKVEGLEEFLNHPIKQHLLINQLPFAIRQKIFYKRYYIQNFFKNLQSLACMGLLHFAPLEKHRERDQVLCHLKRNATIVDTINAEPHYWLVSEPPDKPFERRRYCFTSVEDLDTYWFDLMCVCLNTPLGLIRTKRGSSATSVDEVTPSFVHEKDVFVGMASLLQGSNYICDDGTTPGNGKGAAGLDSEFFAHLKRNWLWTNRLLACKKIKVPDQSKMRLKSLLSKEALRATLKAGASSSSFLTAKKSVVTKENVEVAIEPASRNQQVVGGKQRKRKRLKKEVVKVPRKKKKEPYKRTPAHDEADHRALKKMTRQRVIWTVQEDSLLMLCAVASHLLNNNLRKTFVPYCLVRDLLQEEFHFSGDKTSLAAGRRTRYILKNPQTFLNYRICLAEICQDKDLVKQLHDNNPADPQNVENCAKAFMEYVRLIRQKFSSALSGTDVELPQSKHQLFSRSKVCTIQTEKQIPCGDNIICTTDIHALVLFNLIQSTLAMTNHQMKESRSFQTFHIYSQYSQEILCQVFIQCRRRHLLNRRRVYHITGPKKNRALPILPMSFQLSQSYFRLFSWRFPRTLCTDSFRFVKALLNNGTGDDASTVSYYLETENRTENGEEVAERAPPPPREVEEAEGGQSNGPDISGMMLFSLDSLGGACMVSLTLMSLGLLSVNVSIPQKMVVVDTNIVDHDVRSMGSLEEEDDDDEVAGDDCEAKKKSLVKDHRASHTKYLIMKGFCVPGIVKNRNLNASDNIVLEWCVIRMRLRQTPLRAMLSDSVASVDFSKCGPSLLPSVLTRCIRNAEPAPAWGTHYSHEDLQACTQLRNHLDGAGEKGVDQAELFRELAHLRLPQSGRSWSLERYLEDLQEQGHILKVGAYGVRWVLIQHAQPWILTFDPRNWSQWQAAPSEGRSQHNIPFLHRRRRARARRDAEAAEEPPAKKKAMDQRLEQEQDKEAERPVQPRAEDSAGKGSIGQERAETGERCRPAEDKTEDNENDGKSTLAQQANFNEESVSFVSRPWRLVDGTINRQVCKGMLEAVLYHIMSRPGIPQQRLLSYYEGVLQPVVVLELLQALVELGCVAKKTLVKRAKASLFGPSAPTAEDQQEFVFYEPTVSCCLMLAQVLPNERNWNYCAK